MEQALSGKMRCLMHLQTPNSIFSLPAVQVLRALFSLSFITISSLPPFNHHGFRQGQQENSGII